jgi:hypothetical protein
MSDPNNILSWDDEENEEESASVEVAPPGAPAKVVVPPPNLFSNVNVDVEQSPFNPSAEITSVETIPSADGGDSEHLTIIQVDADGNEVHSLIDLSMPPLEEAEARELTEKIKSTSNMLYVLIKRAHSGKAWLALGYNSFADYVKEEFNYSRSYGYRLLDQANVIEAIEARAPEGTQVFLGEYTARSLKKSLPELLDEVEERTAEASPDEAASIIEDIIRETKDRKEEEESFDEDFDDFNPGDYHDPSSAYDFIDDEEDDDNLDEFLGGDSNDPSEVVRKLDNLYTLLTGLQNFADLAAKDNLDELLPFVPADRHEEVTRLVRINEEWSTRLRTRWEEYAAENGSPVSEGDDSEGGMSFEDDNEF